MRTVDEIIKKAEQLEKEGKLTGDLDYVVFKDFSSFIQVSKINGKWQKSN